jgi:hypothetical protein
MIFCKLPNRPRGKEEEPVASAGFVRQVNVGQNAFLCLIKMSFSSPFLSNESGTDFFLINGDKDNMMTCCVVHNKTASIFSQF